jgi:two-component system, OmpR family, sensor kinase
MMRRALSIRARLFVVFIFLFLLVIVLGFESLNSLSYVNDASAQIRDRWLPSTRALGDLNNLTTDFPAAEAAALRADSPSERDAIERRLTSMDGDVAAAELAYRRIRHDAKDDALFGQFEARWREYRSRLAEVIAKRRPGAASQASYDAASGTLGTLTDHNVASAREASERSGLVYAQAREHIALMILLAGLLVAGAMVHVTRSISAPLVDLAERMHRLAASETSIEVQGALRHDEIGEMARAVLVFRDNAVDLAENRQALAQQAAMLQEKLAEEQRLTLLQRNFVSMASHEFRTPLGIIDGHAQRMISMRDRLTADELAERARKVRNAVRRMTQLIANLISSSRLIDGRIGFNYHPTQVDLTAIVREACHLQQELTPDAQLLDCLEKQPLMVYGDASLLSQVLGNLVSNAVKYSAIGAPVRIKSSQDGAHVAVAIEDHGIGIPDTDRERVFERYYRGSNTSGIVGSGVGLYLVKTIMDLHQGSILVESRENKGSRFTLRLPASSMDWQESVRAPRQLELTSVG